jgi:hypothetical protein
MPCTEMNEKERAIKKIKRDKTYMEINESVVEEKKNNGTVIHRNEIKIMRN